MHLALGSLPNPNSEPAFGMQGLDDWLTEVQKHLMTLK